MSAIVCGKRSLFEDLPSTPTVSKRIRFASTPVRLSPPRTAASAAHPYSSFVSSHLIDHLASIFPDMDKDLLERALEECGDDLDLAIRSLNELRLGSGDQELSSGAGISNGALEPNAPFQSQGIAATSADVPSPPKTHPVNGADWVELFVREMTSASDMDDARTRASRALEVLEKSILARAGAEAPQRFQQENMMLKEQMAALIQENTVLKRAVAIQHERQKENEDKSQELQHLKQLVVQYQEQLRTLEVNNYALTLHLKQAQQGNSIPGRFNPDVF